MTSIYRILPCLFLGLACTAHGGDDLATALQSSRVSGYIKAMYIADDKKGGRPNQSTPGFGGRLAAATGDYYGFTLKGAWYTTQDLGLRSDNPRKIDAYLFDLDKTPYSLLGEAQIQFAARGTTLVLGRQAIVSPLINSYEYRIIPNLFEAATLTLQNVATLPLTFTLAYVDKMSGLDGLVSYAKFRSMSQQTYTSLQVTADGTVDARQGETLDPSRMVGHRGVWVAGAVYAKEQNGSAQRGQLWNYHGSDTLNTLYLDGSYRQNLGPDWSALLDTQAYRVTAVGQFDRYLRQHGLNADYALAGVKATLAHRLSGLSIALAYNQFSGNRQTVTAYGNWGGYPEFVSMPYLFAENDSVSAIARSRLTKLSVLLDLGSYSPHLKNHSLLFGHARINTDATILAGSDIRVNNLLYRARLTPQLSTRIALEARHSGNARYTNDFATLALRYDF